MSNMVAVGAHLRVLREKHGFTRPQLAEAIRKVLPGVKTGEMQVGRIEEGDTPNPGAPLLAAFVHLLGASATQINRLLLDPKATATDAEIAALKYWTKLEARMKSVIEEEGGVEGTTQEDVMRMLRIANEERLSRGLPPLGVADLQDDVLG